MFIFEREWEKQSALGEGQRERETHNLKKAPGFSTEPDVGLELTNHEIMTWAEVRRLTNWATQVPPQTFNIIV